MLYNKLVKSLIVTHDCRSWTRGDTAKLERSCNLVCRLGTALLQAYDISFRLRGRMR